MNSRLAVQCGRRAPCQAVAGRRSLGLQFMSPGSSIHGLVTFHATEEALPDCWPNFISVEGAKLAWCEQRGTE